MAGEKILVIDDEPDIREVIRYNLSNDGFRVVTAVAGDEGIQAARSESPDLILLDLMLPGVDGLEVCRILKGESRTRTIPIIMVTAKGEESDIVLGLGVGADDYIVKPFSPKELVARVRAVLRRGVFREEDRERIDRGDIVVDAGRHEVGVRGRLVEEFTATEFRLLRFLASHPGRVFTRNRLLDRIGDEATVVTDRTIDVHVRSIRKKLGDCGDQVETVRGVGYRFRDRGSPA